MRGCYDTEIDLYFFKIVKSYSLGRLRLSFLISLYSDGYFGLYPSVDSANVYVHYGIISSQLFFSMIAELVQEKKEIAFIVLERK